MKTLNILIAIFSVSILAGCSTSKVWYQSGKSTAEAERDLAACRAEAARLENPLAMTDAAFAIANHVNKNDFVKNSMIARGYTLVEKNSVPARVSEKPNDLELEKKIIGTWQGQPVRAGDVIVEGKTIYLPGGRMNLAGRIIFPDGQRQVIGSGRWQVKEGYLHWTVETSNVSEMIPNGFSSADKIVSVTEAEFTYSSAGQTKVDKRLRNE